MSIVANEEAQATWDEEDQFDLQEGQQGLQEGWDAPSLVACNLLRGERNTGGKNSTDKVRGVEERGQSWTLLWVAEFSK